jgi:hypothetical protein
VFDKEIHVEVAVFLEPAFVGLGGKGSDCAGPQFLDRCVSLSRPSHLEERNVQTHQL